MLSPSFGQALVYTQKLHAGHRRKGKDVPYLAHLLAVAALVLEDGGSEAEATAALLHDAIEDIGPDFSGGPDALRRDIAKRFGAEVLEIVEGCTDADTDPKPPWRQRKEAYIRSLEQAAPEVLRVSLADKLHNVRDLIADYHAQGEALWDRFSGKREGTLWYYAELAAAYRRCGAPERLAGELERAVAELRRLAG